MYSLLLLRVSFISSTDKMKPAVFALIAVGLAASISALPVGTKEPIALVGTGSSIDLIPGNLNSWKKELTVAGQKITLGLGYAKGNTVTASAGIVANINSKLIPIGAAISTNIKDVKNTLKYQVGAQVEEVTGIVSGDASGNINYLINAWPIVVSNNGKDISIGVGVEGENLKPELLGAAVGYENEVANVQVGLDSNNIPDSVNVAVSGDIPSS